MRFLGRDSDGRVDLYLSSWVGVAMVVWGAVMWAQGWGDTILQLFFVISGVVPIVLNHALHGRET